MKRLIVIEQNRERMHLLADLFIDMLDTKLETVGRGYDYVTITTATYHIRFYCEVNEFKMRGIKADFVINGSNDPMVEYMIKTSVTVDSKYRERLL